MWDEFAEKAKQEEEQLEKRKQEEEQVSLEEIGILKVFIVLLLLLSL